MMWKHSSIELLSSIIATIAVQEPLSSSGNMKFFNGVTFFKMMFYTSQVCKGCGAEGCEEGK
jgi:hypothetical protein